MPPPADRGTGSAVAHCDGRSCDLRLRNHQKQIGLPQAVFASFRPLRPSGTPLQGAGPRHARPLRGLRVAPVSLRALATGTLRPFLAARRRTAPEADQLHFRAGWGRHHRPRLPSTRRKPKALRTNGPERDTQRERAGESKQTDRQMPKPACAVFAD